MNAACSDITINGNIITGDINLGAASSIVLSNNKFVNLIASTLGTVLATGNYTTGTGIPGHLAIHPNSTGNV